MSVDARSASEVLITILFFTINVSSYHRSGGNSIIILNTRAHTLHKEKKRKEKDKNMRRSEKRYHTMWKRKPKRMRNIEMNNKREK